MEAWFAHLSHEMWLSCQPQKLILQSGKPIQEAQEDHRAKNPHPMLAFFCQVNMTKKVTQEMFMYKLVFNKNIFKFFPIYLYVKQVTPRDGQILTPGV